MSDSETSSECLSFPACGDCHLDFDDDQNKPLLLPCNHTFCRSCLNDQEDADCQNCSSCQESWSASNVARLPVVYDLIPPCKGATGREVEQTQQPGSSAGRGGVSTTGREVTPMDTSESHGRGAGALGDKSKGLSSFPTCNICNENFNSNSQRPLMLPCDHCFCQTCLQALRTSARSLCPTCRGDWATADISQLPVIKNLIHPKNARRDVPGASSDATGSSRGGLSDEDRLKAAEALCSRNDTQAKQTKSNIYIKDTQNRMHKVSVDLQRDKVTKLRTQVQQVTGVQPQAQRLLYNNRHLEDGYNLAHYGMRRNDTVTQTCRLQGGAV